MGSFLRFGGVVIAGACSKYVRRNRLKIEYCYEKQLLAKPGLAGRVIAQFFITPNGDVASSSAMGNVAAVGEERTRLELSQLCFELDPITTRHLDDSSTRDVPSQIQWTVVDPRAVSARPSL